ncbi:hypothetical protein [Flagellimonas halotolerans]|uniref:Transposase n=1 Tax=Flagellimonas halotolerans TaxID=3112164 RepID=A0ABU6IUE4_9FLAO|nr:MULTISPECIES: hypothetical protein [unclassified Allomuricauda]MEC3966842.1 hypothetical protein [Muricauda sp. SYSU M86414]MEC4266752.1 hypothetical protein [Muricauda sp. SYSU M84420]
MHKKRGQFTCTYYISLNYVRGDAAAVCRELELNPSVLGRWRRAAKKIRGERFP